MAELVAAAHRKVREGTATTTHLERVEIRCDSA